MDKKEIQDKITKLLSDNPEMDVNDAINEIVGDDDVENEEPPKLIEEKRLCNNFWCKSWFNAKYFEGDEFPKQCPKCVDFDTNLSGGIESGEKHYEGPRHDGLAHEVEFNFSKYKDGKGFWNNKSK